MAQKKTTPLQKGYRTAYQGVASLLIHLPFILLIPEVRDLVDIFPPIIGLSIAAIAGVISYYQNKQGK